MAVNSEAVNYLYLPPKTSLQNKYLVEQKLSAESNLSIVYLAQHLGNKERVVIKEFFPCDFVLRDLDGETVVCKYSSQQDKFEQKKEQFLQEAAIMNQLTNEYTARCYESFRANNTAYLVMKYYRGQDLTGYLTENKSLFEFLEEVFFRLLQVVGKFHQQGYIHRDLKPNNIIMYLDKPILIDFGAVVKYRQVEEKEKMLTPGYSPLEFYSPEADQGPYSDIYSLAAILYYFCTGQLPLEASERIIEDDLVPVKNLTNGPEKYLNDLIMTNLSLSPEARSQSIASFRANLKKELAKLKVRRMILSLTGSSCRQSTS